MKNLFLLVNIFIFSISFGQDLNELAKIQKEGELLYKSEMASWYGTDLFLEKNKDVSTIGGYFSYVEEKNAKCIFFSKEEIPQVIGTITFDESFSTENAKIDLSKRVFTENETNYFTIRQKALKEIQEDSIFVLYKYTSFNIIPVITETESKVIVLTGPKKNNVVIFGNDYEILFDKEFNVVSKRKIHQNIITIEFGGEKETVSTMHNHSENTGEYITSTDICTLMLYGKFTEWESHIVVSDKFMTNWIIKTNSLIIVNSSDFKKGKNKKKKKRD